MTEKYTSDELEKELLLPEGSQELLLPTGDTGQPEINKISDNVENIDYQNKALEESRKIIDEQSINKEVLAEEIESVNAEKKTTQNTLTSDSSKYLAKQNLINIRRNLNKKDKILSGVVNNEFVEKISEGASRTIARPSGFLGGAILAFIGSLSYLIFVKYVGINYNYLLFFGFFIVGFLVGVLIEFAFKLKH